VLKYEIAVTTNLARAYFASPDNAVFVLATNRRILWTPMTLLLVTHPFGDVFFFLN
jgi:hypothetical protein